MLQKSLLFGFAFLFSFSLQAQRKRNLSLGPLVGVNVSNLQGDIENTTSKVGVVAGLFFNYSIKETFGVSGQLLYSQLGANYKFGSTSNQLRLNYLQVPLFATFYFGRGLRPGTIRPKLFAGPYVGFLLAQRDKDGNDLPVLGSGTPYKPIDFGLNLGGGLNFALKNQSWVNLDLKYGLGLVDISRADNSVIRNGVFSITAGISFPLGNYDERSRSIRR